MAARVCGVLVVGLGGVGIEVVRRLCDDNGKRFLGFGVQFTVVGVVDSSSAVVATSASGLSSKQVEEAISLKQDGQKLSAHSGGGAACNTAAAVDACVKLSADAKMPLMLVDCTASDATTKCFAHAVKTHTHVGAAFANKKPVASTLEAFDVFTDPSIRSRVGLESTVGAGTPIVRTLLHLLQSGDRVRRVQGCFSGTLGFITSGMSPDKQFSELVYAAHKLGYTEPDARDDLGGMDVARKGLILGRLCGLRLSLDDIKVEPLYKDELGDRAAVTPAEFLERIPEMDSTMQSKASEAAAADKVLRYTATVDVDAKTIEVGLKALDVSSSMGRLQGTANICTYVTDIYPEKEPLVVQGSGAGVGVTACGVIADMVSCVPALTFS